MTERLPLLPLRDACLLPGMRMEIRVGRPGSVQALGHSADGLIAVQQLRPTNARPRQAQDFYGHGCTARVDDIHPDASALAVTLVGMERVRLVGVNQQMLSLQGIWTPQQAHCDHDTSEAILALFAEHAQALGLDPIRDPHMAVYTLVHSLKVPKLQEVLDADDLALPLQLCLERLDHLDGVEWLH